MSVNVTEYMTKFQEEGLNAMKRTQDASLEAMHSFQKFAKEFNEKPGTMPTFENMPSPTQLVEMSFGFVSQLLEMRKAYTMQIAEMMTDAQKRAEWNVKAAANAATNGSHNPSTSPSNPVSQNPNPNAPMNKPVVK